MASRGRQYPLQNVIAPLEGAGLFKGQKISGGFDHTQFPRVPSRVGTDPAQLTVREMEAARTGAHAVPKVANPLGQLLGILPRTLQKEHGNAGSALFAEAGKLAQAPDEIRQKRGISVHRLV